MANRTGKLRPQCIIAYLDGYSRTVPVYILTMTSILSQTIVVHDMSEPLVQRMSEFSLRDPSEMASHTRINIFRSNAVLRTEHFIDLLSIARKNVLAWDEKQDSCVHRTQNSQNSYLRDRGAAREDLGIRCNARGTRARVTGSFRR